MIKVMLKSFVKNSLIDTSIVVLISSSKYHPILNYNFDQDIIIGRIGHIICCNLLHTVTYFPARYVLENYVSSNMKNFEDILYSRAIAAGLSSFLVNFILYSDKGWWIIFPISMSTLMEIIQTYSENWTEGGREYFQNKHPLLELCSCYLIRR